MSTHERVRTSMTFNRWAMALVAVSMAALGATGLPERANAQSFPSVDAAGACPRTEDLARFNAALNDGSIRSLQDRMGSPVRNDLPMYRNSSLTDPKVEKPPLSADDDVEVLIGARLDSRGPSLVRRLRDNVCGWIDVSTVEKSGVPLKLIQIPGFDSEVDRRRRPNQLDARVVVKNRIDQQTGYAQRAPLFNAPFEGDEPPESQRRGNVGYFEVLSVYEVRRANGDRCRNFFEPGCFLRVGTTTEAARGAQGVTRQRGWMLGKDVEIWPSALAVYYGLGRQGLKIHKFEPSARIGTPFADAGAEPKVLAFQPPGRYEEPRETNIMRFPVIRGTAYAPRMQLTPGPRQGADSPSYVYEVVFSGQACVEDRAAGQSNCIPEPQVKDEIARLGRSVKAISNIDVLFVVDTTESMGPYLRSVVGAIRKHVTELAARNEGSFRHSVVLYGDYNAEGKLEDYFALPFSAVNDITGIDRLQNVQPYGDVHKDKPEAPFAALERAILNANWSPEAAQRLVIWIADHGNRKPGTSQTKGGFTLVEDKSAQNVIAAIKTVDERMKTGTSAGTKTHFVALQVKGGANASSQEEFRKFREDADTIARAIGERIYQTIPAPNNMTGDREVDALRDSIANQIKVNVDTIGAARDGVLGALGGDTTRLQRNVPEAVLAREYLAQLGFSMERLVEIGRRIQLVGNGFVYQSGTSPDYRYWLGLRRPEFNGVRSTARDLCENLLYSDRGAYIEDAILKLVKAVTFGVPEPGETVRDYFSRIFSVPATNISTVLEATPDEFMRRMRQQNPQNRQIAEKVCRSARLLELVGEGQVVDNPDRDIVVSQNQTALRAGVTPRRFDWRWISPDARSEWFFVPMDYLP